MLNTFIPGADETCWLCDLDRHRCKGCGCWLDHCNNDNTGRFHALSECRPDLFPHEPGVLCTAPATGNAEYDSENGLPRCYWDHVAGKIDRSKL